MIEFHVCFPFSGCFSFLGLGQPGSARAVSDFRHHAVREHIADDQTVTLTSGSSAVVAGVVRDVTAGGVVAEIGNGPL